MVVVNRIFLAIAWIGAVALGSPVARSQGDPAQNGHIHYDTSKCSKDPQGMVYFAVGRRVLRQPMANITYITLGPAAYLASLPAPPDPSEPIGCPDHPIQGLAYDLRRLSAMPNNPPNSASAYADRVGLVIGNGHFSSAENGLFDLMCRTYTLRDDSVPDFAGCKKPFRCDQDIAYQAEKYREPDGGKMALFCSVGINCSPRPISCEGGYKLHDDFAVHYEFATSSVPVAEIVATDRELQRRFDAAEVKDFRWQSTRTETTREKPP